MAVRRSSCARSERDGAVAIDERMRRHEVAAEPANVRDTNGAGDAFMAGVLDATLSGSPLPDALHAGARHAASVLGHPTPAPAAGRAARRLMACGRTSRHHGSMDELDAKATPHPRATAAASCSRVPATRRRGAARPTCSRVGGADATVGPSPVDLRTSVAYDALALDAAEGYEGLLLSPGDAARIDVRPGADVPGPDALDDPFLEVVSDPTNVLALESARRLRADPTAHVRLCTTHQVLRMQPDGEQTAGRTQHFRLFVMADAGPGLPDDEFEVAAVVAQLEAYRRMLDTAGLTRAVHWERAAAIVRSDGTAPALADRVVGALGSAQPDVDVRTEPLASDYYHGLRVGYGVHTDVGRLRRDRRPRPLRLGGAAHEQSAPPVRRQRDRHPVAGAAVQRRRDGRDGPRWPDPSARSAI